MSCLPEELVVELLTKLPAKSIFRFRCVSKQWLHLLSSSQGPCSVKNLHNKRHNQTPFLLAWNDVRYDRWLERQDVRPNVPKHPRKDGYRYNRMYVIHMLTNKLHHEFTLDIPQQYQEIVSCHGLVFFTSDGVINVCNPSTGETIELPKSSTNYHGVRRTGLGYLPSVNQYKVVRWFDNYYNGVGFEIITLIDGGKVDSYSWRSVRCVYLGLKKKHLCVNGVIYWLTKDQKRMLAFDLEDEKHEIISVPSPDVGHWKMMELKGSLCLAETTAYRGSERLIKEIWRLNDKKFCLEWSPTYDICKWFAYLDSSFIADEGKKVLVSVSHRGARFIANRKEVLVLESWHDAFSLGRHRHTHTRTDAMFKLMGIPNLDFGIFELYPCVYFDSLFSLNGS